MWVAKEAEFLQPRSILTTKEEIMVNHDHVGREKGYNFEKRAG